jgi:hypothetical protein
MNESDTGSLSADVYQFWAVDYEAGQLTIVFQSGKRVVEPLAGDRQSIDFPIAKSIFDWEKWWITTITRRGDLVIFMGYNPTNEPMRPHRPAVYLDQNKWSLIAASLVTPERVKDTAELEAAKEVLRFANDDGIVLPLSSAHLLETSALHTERRYEVGIAIASLSAGWQMRHPMNVLQHEAALSLGQLLAAPAAALPMPRPVITTEPHAWEQAPNPGLGETPDGSAGVFLEMLKGPSALVAQLVDPDPLAREPATTWAEHHARITRQFATIGGTKEVRRAVARRRYWNENLGIYRHALIHRFKSYDFPTFSDSELKRFLGRGEMTSLLSELFSQRFLDRNSRWSRNDLIDMLYLSCAAGHCDYVVCEARTGTQLRQIQRQQGKPQTVFTSLSSLVEALHVAGTTTDTDRRAARGGQ